MDYAQIMRDAAAEAQDVIAQMMGMEPGAAGNFTYGNGTFVGVFGQASVVEIPQPTGGYRRRAELVLTVTRTQTGFVPVAKTRLIRLFPAVSYIIDRIDTNDPLVWVLTLVLL